MGTILESYYFSVYIYLDARISLYAIRGKLKNEFLLKLKKIVFFLLGRNEEIIKSKKSSENDIIRINF